MKPVFAQQLWPHFVGRDHDLVETQRLLAQTRLLTLAGPGGIGKTRLAMQLADLVADDYPDGVYFVSLASITDPDVVLPTIAHALGLYEYHEAALFERLVEVLRDQRVLLVLDNLEQVIDAAGQIWALLQATSAPRIIVTSRVILHLAAEQVYPLPPLRLPDPQQPLTLEQIAACEAVQLFVTRAQASRPDFTLTDGNAHTVLEICRRLDGLPLAIELAAARVRALTPQALLARLGRRLPVLVGTLRDVHDRHRTLRNAFAWSYDSLSSEEQRFFRALAVFADGCTLEAVEVVCGEHAVSAAEPAGSDRSIAILDLLESLIDKSLLEVREVDGESRLMLLQTVREYAWEQLVAHGEEGAALQRRALYFAQLAERALPALHGPEQQIWFQRLIADHANMRASLEWAHEQGDAAVALRLVSALWPYWAAHGPRAEVYGWITSTLTMPVSRDESLLALRLKALWGAGYLASEQALYAAARTHFAEALDLSQQIGDERMAAMMWNLLGRVHGYEGDTLTARRHYASSLSTFQRLNDLRGIASVTKGLGLAALFEGDLASARDHFEQCLVLFREVGEQWAIAAVLTLLGDLLLQQGDLEGARARFYESARLRQPLQLRVGISETLEGLAGVALASNQAYTAALLLGAAAGLRKCQCAHPLLPWDQRHQQYAAEARRRLGSAMFERARAEGAQLSVDEALQRLEHALAPAEPMPAVRSLAWRSQVDTLTTRELEVLRLIATGLSNKAVAQHLALSVYTVQDHVRAILGKLGVSSRTAAARYAFEQRLFERPPAEAA